jgi:hypothetical protein
MRRGVPVQSGEKVIHHVAQQIAEMEDGANLFHIGNT